MKPIRNQALTWEQDDEGLVTINMEFTRSRMGRWLGILFYIPKKRTRTFELDAIGSFVWERCDGKKNVNKLTTELSKQYNLSKREAEVSLLTYLKTLAERNLIGFVVRHKDMAG